MERSIVASESRNQLRALCPLHLQHSFAPFSPSLPRLSRTRRYNSPMPSILFLYAGRDSRSAVTMRLLRQHLPKRRTPTWGEWNRRAPGPPGRAGPRSTRGLSRRGGGSTSPITHHMPNVSRRPLFGAFCLMAAGMLLLQLPSAGLLACSYLGGPAESCVLFRPAIVLCQKCGYLMSALAWNSAIIALLQPPRIRRNPPPSGGRIDERNAVTTDLTWMKVRRTP